MILRQFLNIDPIAATYLLGCGGKSAGAVVYPVGDIAPYLAAAEAEGAQCVLHAGAPASFNFKGIQDGDVLELGNVAIRVLHTPGHTPEHISLVVTDRTRSNDPWFILTGHTLKVGDRGRTELTTIAEAGARDLFQSVQTLKALPDWLEVLPDAYSGSVCGRSLSGKPTSTIGFEKRNNRAFRVEHEGAFVRMMVADIPPPPPDAAQIRAMNAGQLAAVS